MHILFSVAYRTRRVTTGALLTALFAGWVNLSIGFSDEPEFGFDSAWEVLRQSCIDCHDESAAEGEFAVAQLDRPSSLRDDFARWQKIRQRVLDRSMPPKDAEPLDDDVREALADWIDTAATKAICDGGPFAGPPLLRRLARHEYSNTMRDLLGIHFDAGHGLPEDAAGGEGFNNAAETLMISPIHAEKYLQAATDALDYASRDAKARALLLAHRPGESEDEDTAAQNNLRKFAARAFRRPVSDKDVDRYVAVYRDARSEDIPFDASVLYAMRGILISPYFLFIAEAPPDKIGETQPLSNHELATRLSYFLWASMPDEELLRSADSGTLANDEELTKQTLRLIKQRGTHLQDSMESFVGQWLGTADLGKSKKVDRERHPWLEDPHIAALRNQPIYAMESILQENESVISLIDAPWSFMNNELVRVYGIDRDKIKEKFVQRLVKVNLPDEYRYRGGLVGMGGVHAVSSYPRRSSPVLRGAWVLEKMLGTELPPPPPNIPSLDQSQEVVTAKTLRERLEQHRENATCATCHDRIDPIGFALENFDEIGHWRENDDGGAINAVASMADGTVIDGVTGLKNYLLQHKDVFTRNLTRKMLGYALGRSLRPEDLCTVELISQRLRNNEYKSHELVLGIVMSEPFRKKMISASLSE